MLKITFKKSSFMSLLGTTMNTNVLKGKCISTYRTWHLSACLLVLSVWFQITFKNQFEWNYQQMLTMGQQTDHYILVQFWISNRLLILTWCSVNVHVSCWSKKVNKTFPAFQAFFFITIILLVYRHYTKGVGHNLWGN